MTNPKKRNFPPAAVPSRSNTRAGALGNSRVSMYRRPSAVSLKTDQSSCKAIYYFFLGFLVFLFVIDPFEREKINRFRLRVLIILIICNVADSGPVTDDAML